MYEPETLEQQVAKARPSRKGVATGKFYGNERPELDEKAIENFNVLTPEKQTRLLKERWMRIANILGMKGEQFARYATKKDFGRLQQLLISVGIAYDKVVPKHEGVMPQNLIVQLFGSLPYQELKQVSTPETPAIDLVKETPKDGSKTPTFRLTGDLRGPNPGGEPTG